MRKEVGNGLVVVRAADGLRENGTDVDSLDFLTRALGFVKRARICDLVLRRAHAHESYHDAVDGRGIEFFHSVARE